MACQVIALRCRCNRKRQLLGLILSTLGMFSGLFRLYFSDSVFTCRSITLLESPPPPHPFPLQATALLDLNYLPHLWLVHFHSPGDDQPMVQYTQAWISLPPAVRQTDMASALETQNMGKVANWDDNGQNCHLSAFMWIQFLAMLLSVIKDYSFFQQYSPVPNTCHIPFQVLWDTAASIPEKTPWWYSVGEKRFSGSQIISNKSVSKFCIILENSKCYKAGHRMDSN